MLFINRKTGFAILLWVLSLVTGCRQPAVKSDSPENIIAVSLNTSMGEIVLALYPDKAPVSVKNFIDYVNAGFYTGTVFHRVIDGFMIQGGGFDVTMNEKETRNSILNEAGNGLHNSRGTIAYARTQVIDSATSQFFINLVDNHRLNHRGDSPADFGYAVFGQVTEGMEVVDHIGKVKTGSQGMHNDVPVDPVIIISASVTGDH